MTSGANLGVSDSEKKPLSVLSSLCPFISETFVFASEDGFSEELVSMHVVLGFFSIFEKKIRFLSFIYSFIRCVYCIINVK